MRSSDENTSSTVSLRSGNLAVRSEPQRESFQADSFCTSWNRNKGGGMEFGFPADIQSCLLLWVKQTMGKKAMAAGALDFYNLW